MGKYEYLQKLSEPGRGIPVPRFVEAASVVAGDRAFVRALVGEGPYSVRSSCDGEDSLEVAHAGQYVSRVGVTFEELPDAIEAVRSSYGPALGKVIVQQIVEPVVSGVAFSSSPEGFVGETVVAFGAGFGEGVVSDASETVTYHISDDDTCVWVAGDEGLLPALPVGCTDYVRLAREVRELCRRCAQAIDTEADVEFALDATGKVWILQARPITRLAGMGQRAALDSAELLDSSNIVESYPGIVLPLTQSFATRMYQRIFTAAVDRLTGTPEMSGLLADDLARMLVFSDWHAYYRLASWYSVLSLAPFSGTIKKAWRSSLGVEHTSGDHGLSAAVPRAVKRTVVRSFLHFLKDSPREVGVVCDRVQPALDAARRKADTSCDAAELLRAIGELQDEVLSCWDVTLFNDVYTFLWTHLAGGKARRVAAAERELASLRPVRAMRELVGTARASGLDSAAYQEARREFIAAYGDRAPMELKLETRTWRSDPTSLDAYVASVADGADAGAGGAGAADNAEGRRGGFAMKNALAGAAMREKSRLMRTQMFGIVRSCYDKIGTSLCARGVIAHALDVYYLTTDEVAQAVAHECDLHEAVAQRKLHEALLAEAPAPKTLRVCGAGPWDHSAGSLGAQLHVPSWGDHATATGTGTSPRRVVGEAVVMDGRDAGASTDGKVIVARSTDPGWAYLLDGAAAIVAERGSMLSHTAIISRELGIPAVVGVADATTEIATGDVVEVDGSAGTVRIVTRCRRV